MLYTFNITEIQIHYLNINYRININLFKLKISYLFVYQNNYFLNFLNNGCLTPEFLLNSA